MAVIQDAPLRLAPGRRVGAASSGGSRSDHRRRDVARRLAFVDRALGAAGGRARAPDRDRRERRAAADALQRATDP